MNRRATAAAAAVLAAACTIVTACDSSDGQSPPAAGQSTVTVTEHAPAQNDSTGQSEESVATTTSMHADCSVPGGVSATVTNAISRIAPPLASNPSAGWQPGTSNLDGCRDLSYVVLDTSGATASSPNQLLLFHKGAFLGTGTRCNLAYQRVTGADDANVHVTYQYLMGDDISAAPSGRFDVTYHWTGSQVQMIGTIPAAVSREEC